MLVEILVVFFFFHIQNFIKRFSVNPNYLFFPHSNHNQIYFSSRSWDLIVLNSFTASVIYLDIIRFCLLFRWNIYAARCSCSPFYVFYFILFIVFFWSFGWLTLTFKCKQNKSIILSCEFDLNLFSMNLSVDVLLQHLDCWSGIFTAEVFCSIFLLHSNYWCKSKLLCWDILQGDILSYLCTFLFLFPIIVLKNVWMQVH